MALKQIKEIIKISAKIVCMNGSNINCGLMLNVQNF